VPTRWFSRVLGRELGPQIGTEDRVEALVVDGPQIGAHGGEQQVASDSGALGGVRQQDRRAAVHAVLTAHRTPGTRPGGTGRVTLAERTGSGPISRADVAAVLLAPLDEPRLTGRTVEVIGGATPIADAVAAHAAH
jgi:hypothetical protein